MSTAFAPVTSSRRQRLIASLLEKAGVKSGGDRIPRRGADVQFVPLSSGQRRLWFLDRVSAGSPVYNVPTCFRIRGSIDVQTFRRSLQAIVQRHEILRTTFEERNGEPFQIIAENADVSLSIADLSEETSPDFKARALEEALRPFDLKGGPLLRVLLMRLSDDDHVVVITMHHIVCDGWSMGVLFRELSGNYASLVRGAAPAPSELPVQYGDYAIWQRERLEAGRLASQIDYWRQHLRDAPGGLELPCDKKRPRQPGFRGSVLRSSIDCLTADSLGEIARNESTTFFVVLLAAYGVLLHRYSGQRDFVVGSPVSNRSRPELEPLIGFLPNTLPMRVNTSGNPPFLELLRRLKETVSHAFANAEAPFDVIVDGLGGARTRHSLFQVAFTTQEQAPSRTTFGDIEISPIELDLGKAKCDLTLTGATGSGGIQLAFEYSEDLFTVDTVRRMSAHFRTLLEGIALNPDSTLADLPLMTEQEELRVVCEWSRTEITGDASRPLHEIFEQHAALQPEAPALMYGSAITTYAELNRRANYVAHTLRHSGAGHGALVAIALRRSPELIAAILGTLKSGAAWMPLALDHPSDRIAFQIEDAHPMMLITTAADRPALPASALRLDWLDASALDAKTSRQNNPGSLARDCDLAYVIYTSGSTGRPKGVMIEHRGLANLAQAQHDLFHQGHGQHILQFAPPTFDASVWEIAMAFGSGACLCLGAGAPFAPEELTRVLREQQITTVTLPPSLLRALHEADFPDLQTVISAGEDCPESLAQIWSRDRSFFNCYGPTETTVCATALRFLPSSGAMSIGRALRNVRTYILDAAMRPLPAGIPGELHVGGAGVARGYLNRPELTRSRFVDNPFEPEGRLYKTGDLARYLPNGAVEFLGRIDGQVKLRGHRIEPGEIEARIESHPAVRECAVVLHGGNSEDGKTTSAQLVAYFVPRAAVDSAAAIDSDTLRAYTGQTLPQYMVPSVFVSVAELPVNSSGKIDRLALSQMPLRQREAQIDARDELEDAIAQIWAEALGLDRVDVTHNFFELGGNSLMALNVLSKIEERTGCHLPATALFDAGTVEHIACVVRERGNLRRAAGSLVRLQPHGTKPPLILVAPAGGSLICYSELARLLGPDQPVTGIELPPGKPPETVEALAAQYIGQLDATACGQPFHLGGWSFGGVAAFEMARQLAGRNRPVENVVVFDSRLIHEGEDPDETDILIEIGRVQALARGIEFRLKGGSLRRLEPHHRAMFIAAQMNRTSGARLETIAMELNTTLRLFQANMRAARRYVPREYGGCVTLLRAAGEQPAGDYGWSRYCPGLTIRDVPGTHRSMLVQPQVTALEKILRDSLEYGSGQKCATAAS